MRFSIIFLLAALVVNVCSGQVTDTLGFSNFYAGTPVLYTSPNGGYAFGNNGYGDKAKAQTYSDSVPFVLKGVLLDFGAISFNSADSLSVVRVSAYYNDGFGVTPYGQSDSIAPDSVRSFIDIPVYQMVGAQLVEVYFEDTLVVYANEKFSVGVDFTGMNSLDTVGLMSTTDGDAMANINAWEYTSGNTWFSVAEGSFSWGLDVDLAIFALIDKEDPAGIDEFDASGFSLYPNPAKDLVNINFIEQDAVSVSVFDTHGNVVGQYNPQTLKKPLDISGLASGIYSIRVVYPKVTRVMKLVKV